MTIKENFDLTNLNTFKVKAFARYFVKAKTETELTDALEFAKKENLEILFLGEGSNILFTKDFDGLVINLAFDKILIEEEDDETALIIADAGAKWDDAVDFAVRNELWGIENLSAIPGTAGAAPVQNIGAYGTEISQTLDFIEGYEIETIKKHRLQKSECDFGYRTSVFKTELKNKFVITKIALRLSKKPKPNLNYRDLRERFSERNPSEISLSEIRGAITEIRNAKLPSPSDFPNAGSFFKNPVIEKEKLAALKKKFPQLTFHGINKDLVKLSAAQLIDFAGLKGFRENDAGVSEKHALVLVNYGNASGKEVFALAEKIRNTVLEKFNISLEFEVNVI
jgi:UDP-N-acetylmuramate dehydrogenase